MKDNVPQILFVVFLILVAAGFLNVMFNSVIYPLLQLFKKKNESGYVLTKYGELEHRAIAEKILGTKLSPGLVVHHINGKKWDNRRSNLAVMNHEAHLRWHEKLNWMYSKKMFPKIPWQRKNLIEKFGAVLF